MHSDTQPPLGPFQQCRKTTPRLGQLTLFPSSTGGDTRAAGRFSPLIRNGTQQTALMALDPGVKGIRSNVHYEPPPPPVSGWLLLGGASNGLLTSNVMERLDTPKQKISCNRSAICLSGGTAPGLPGYFPSPRRHDGLFRCLLATRPTAALLL